jgi:MoaA/NifB/PqqE/SkfB family radical SAM enzyme
MLVNDIKSVHIELTDKCQAQCPMCARNHHGGKTRSFIRNGDISLAQFKEWFPTDFLAQLDNFYSCGNYGDPAFASDCLEIYAYVRECNPAVRLALHTNGGMRSPRWWRELAQFDIEVVFAVDGFKGKHELYRKNTNFDKVIENMKAFISAGGKVRVDSLVFKHNETDVNELEEYLLDLGVKEVKFISTTRFYEMDQFEVHDNDGNIEYYLEPTTLDRFKMTPNRELEKLVDAEYRKNAIENSVIDPRCKNGENEIYVDPYGNIFPCCWTGSEYLEDPIKEKMPIHMLRNLSIQNTKEMFAQLGVPNCHTGVLRNNQELFSDIEKYWNGKNKCMICTRQCSKIMYNSKSKYEQWTIKQE